MALVNDSASKPAPVTKPLIIGENPETGDAFVSYDPFRSPEETIGSLEEYIKMYSNNPEIRSVLSGLEKNAAESRVQQLGNLNEIKNSLEGYKAIPAQVDLSGLAALTDTWTGSKFAQSYKAPASPEAKIADVIGLQNSLQKGLGNLSETERNALNDRLKNYSSILGVASNAFNSAHGRNAQSKERNDLAKGRFDIQEIQLGERFVKDTAEPVRELGSMEGDLQKVKGLIKKLGVIPSPGTPEFELMKGHLSRAAVAYNKHMAGLGALSGADLTMIMSGLGSANIMDKGGWLNSYVQEKMVGASSLINNIDTVIALSNNKVTTSEKMLNKLYKGRIQDVRDEAFNNYRSIRGVEQKNDKDTEEVMKKNAGF